MPDLDGMIDERVRHTMDNVLRADGTVRRPTPDL